MQYSNIYLQASHSSMAWLLQRGAVFEQRIDAMDILTGMACVVCLAAFFAQHTRLYCRLYSAVQGHHILAWGAAHLPFSLSRLSFGRQVPQGSLDDSMWAVVVNPAKSWHNAVSGVSRSMHDQEEQCSMTASERLWQQDQGRSYGGRLLPAGTLQQLRWQCVVHAALPHRSGELSWPT